jgi:hypothetical protein
MKRQEVPKIPADHRDAGEAVLTQWRMQSEPPPPDNFLHGRYWEDEMPLKDDPVRPAGLVLSIAAVLVSLGATIGAALSYVN